MSKIYNMNFGNTSCCGMREITNLSSHANAKAAMLGFCKVNFAQTSQLRFGSTNIKPRRVLYTHYIFTAAVYDEKKPNYGSNFADFITENKLGAVTTTGPEYNFLVHPDHKVQAWIWTPDEKALRAWWDATGPDTRILELEAERDAHAKTMKTYEQYMLNVKKEVDKRQAQIDKILAEREAKKAVLETKAPETAEVAKPKRVRKAKVKNADTTLLSSAA